MLTGASRWLLALGLLCLPAAVSAKQIHTYEFRDQEINATWEGIGPIGMQKQPTGVLLTTQDETGAIVTDAEPGFLADAGMVILTAEHPGRLHFVWLYTEDPEHRTNAVPMDFDDSQGQNVYFSLAHSSHWAAGTKRVGIVLPPHTTIVLHRIGLIRWNLMEKAWSGFVSFWLPDRQRPYSINFQWGPQIEFIPTEHNSIYETLPPRSRSAVFTAYEFLLLAWVLLFAYALIRKQPLRRAVRGCVLVLAAMWLLFDVRTGAEFVGWMTKDARMYALRSPEVRTFRDRERFYDFAAFVKPFVADRPSYIFYAQAPWPYLGNMRYLTYPSIPGNAVDTDDTWVIFDRPDLRVDGQGRITADGDPVSPPGRVLGQFDVNSFVFRTTLPPSPQPPTP